MQRPRQVPGIARGPQQFSQRQPVPQMNPMAMPPQIQSSAQTPIQPEDDSGELDLAMEIYCRLALPLAQDVEGYQNPSTDKDFHDKLRRAAMIAKVAAKCFFEKESNNG